MTTPTNAGNTALTQIMEAAERMKREEPTVLKRPTGPTYRLTDEVLGRFARGGHLHMIDWNMLADHLLLPKFPRFNMSFPTRSQKLPDGEKRFSLDEYFCSSARKNSSWYLRVYEASSTEVKVFTVRSCYGDLHTVPYKGYQWGGIDHWKLSYHVHQETSLSGNHHEPFQDAILFDMLLDLAIGDFRPHTRKIGDGPAIQLEILLALEKVQEEAEAAAGITAKKRRLTVQERLDGKRLKQE